MIAGGSGAIFNGLVRGGFPEKVTFVLTFI